VLRPIPSGATAVGAPAKIIGKTLEDDPASNLDEGLVKVQHFRALSVSSSVGSSLSKSNNTEATTSSTDFTSGSDNDGSEDGEIDFDAVHKTESSSRKELSRTNRDICPYREYAAFATKVAKNLKCPTKRKDKCIITIQEFEKCFATAHCSPCQQWAAFFALDTKNRGYLKKDDLVDSKRVTSALVDATILDAQQIEQLLQLIQTR